MSENKCPMPGCDGEIIYHGTEFGTDYDSWRGCTKCHFMCDLDHLPRIAAAMELAKWTIAINLTSSDDPAAADIAGKHAEAEQRVLEVFGK